MQFETLRMMAQDYADRHKEPPSLPAIIDTMAYVYQRICQGEDPWTALGDFSNAWYGYAKISLSWKIPADKRDAKSRGAKDSRTCFAWYNLLWYRCFLRSKNMLGNFLKEEM